MKIACINNMNNMMFSITRYLRDFGFDAELIINNPVYEHFDPSADSYDNSYLKYTKYYSNNFQRASKSQLLSQYGKYDVIIGSSYAPLICNRIGRSLDIFVPHGSDLFSYPFIKLTMNPKSFYYKAVSTYQKKGINEAKIIHMDYTNPELEQIWNRFNIGGTRKIMPIPFLYPSQYDSPEAQLYKKESEICKIMKSIREDNDLVIFHHSSQQWKNPSYSLSQKRNDLLIKGFAKFLKSNPSYKAKLVMVEYGIDIKASKDLILELRIENNVQWLPKSLRKDLLLAIEYADLGAGEFGNSWFSYCTIFEFIARGIPVMHFRNDFLYKDYYPDMYPMFNAASDIDINNVLEEVKKKPVILKEIGYKSKIWFDKFVIKDPINMYLNYLTDFACIAK